jgi:UDP-N-acetylmuramyl pentapeptide phosphotransferase/UDP-N-acetylglucosamine-1-phosphate transferase
MVRVGNLLLILFVLGSFCLAQDNFNLAGNGARAAGMGYAFTGLADDATAISWNAAGLTQLQNMEASVVARLGFGSASYDYPAGIGIDQWDVETQSKFQFNFASFVVPFAAGSRNIVAGVAYRSL